LTPYGPKFVTLSASVAVVVGFSGCGQPAPSGTQPPPRNVSNDAIIRAVLTYKACPTQAETLQVIAAKELAQRNATVLGTAVLRRYGDQAQVAIAYEEQGSHGEATFTYNLSSGQLAGSNAIGQEILKALSAECG
jgi:hypothetical protein